MSDIIPAADMAAMQQRLIAATRESGRWPPHPFSWEELDRLFRYVIHLEAAIRSARKQYWEGGESPAEDAGAAMEILSVALGEANH